MPLFKTKIFKQLFIAVMALFMSDLASAQCTVEISPDPITIDCGESVDLYALGLSATPALSTDFNGNALGPGWSSSATVLYNNPCGPSLDGTASAWFGDVPLPRTLTTNGFDVSCGGQVCFDLDFGADDACGCSDCEDPDQIDEGVYFQYSTDGGATWTDIFYFEPTNDKSGPYYSWANYCFNIPPGGQTANTMFQWSQPNATSTVNDHWGIDNVTIIPSNCGYWYDWANLPGSPDAQGQTVSPVTTTTYDVTYTDGSDACTDQVTVNVNPYVVDATATSTNINCGDCTDLNVTLQNPPTNVCQETASNSGYDADNFLTTINGFACVPGGASITQVLMDASIGTFCTSWYDYDLYIDGVLVQTGMCDVTNFDLTPYLPFNSVSMQSNDNDFFSDNVTMDLILNITYTTNPVYNYSWTPTTDLSSGAVQNPQACPSVTTTYTGTITEANSGCTASDDVTINVTCPCTISNMTANIGACDAATGTYTTTGVVEFIDPPATGQLIIEDCNGNQDVYNAPFSSPVNYTITGQSPDGAACDITAYFSDNTACSQTIPYTAPSCPCNIDVFNANIGLCDQATDTYMMSGDVSFTNPPGSGSLIVEVNNGTTIYDTIINLPATSPQNWSISGIPSDGSASDVTVYFSADPGCSSTIAYTAPTSCACSADLGTFTESTVGGTPNNSVLCYGDAISITSNNDWTGPGEMFNPPGPVYDPGVSWLIYSCPPTVAVTPDPNNAVPDDPCFLGLVSDTDLNDVNDMSWINSFPAGTFTDNTIYWVPITMYSQQDGTYSYVNGTMPCYELGAPYPVQYLPEFTSSYTEDCMTGEAVITVNGGLPAIDGSDFTASNLQPATASFSNTTATDGGTITITGLQGGDNWSFDITDGNGCPYTVTGGPFPPLEDPGFNYPASSWCTTEAPSSPNITGTTGGTFTSTPAGLDIDPNTGTITPAGSTPGTYDVTYTTPGACFDDSTITINVASTPSVDPVADQTVCAGNDFTFIDFTGSAGSSFDWTNDNINIGLAASGSGDIAAFTGTAPTVQEVASITVTPSAGSCVGTAETFTLTVNPQEDPGFNYAQTAWCTSEAAMTPTVTGTTGGTFSSTPAGLSINASTGQITPGTSTAGTYDVTYTTPGPNCVNDSTITITINQTPVVDPVTDQTVCDGDNFTAINFNGPFAGTTFDWTNDNTNIGLAASGTGNIASFAGTAPSGVQEVATITVTPSNANCTGTDETFTLTVNPLDDPSWDYPNGLTYCQTGTDPVANITGMSGGTFSYVTTSGGPNLTLNTADGTVDLDVSDLGTYDITYTTAGVCPQSSTLTLTITDAPIADFTLGTYCANDNDPLPSFINGGTGGVFSSAPGGLVISSSTGEVDLDASTPGTYTVSNFIDGSVTGCANVTYDDDITVNELPDATISGTTTICPSDPLPDVDIALTAGTANWDVTYNLNGNPTTITASSSPYTINGAAIGTYDLVSVTDGNGCTNTLSGQVVVDTFPTPIMTAPTNQYTCENEGLSVNDFVATPVGTTIDWTNTTGTDIGFGLSGTGNIGSFTGVNSTGSPISVTVEVTPTSPDGCVGATQDFLLTVNPLPDVSFTGPAEGCEPLMVTFNNTTPQAGQNCVWDFGDGNTATGCSSVTNTYNAGLFDVSLTVITVEGCTASYTENGIIDVTPVPEASFSYSPQEIDVQDTEVEFINNSTNASNFEWDFGDDSPNMTVENPSHVYPQEPEEYVVTLWAYSDNGMCYDSTQQVITIKDVLIFYVPNVFTPDGDEFNEGFKPVFTSGYDPFDYHLTIFNRWGEIIFESYNAQKGWNGHFGDGGLVQDGVYVWQIDFKETMSDKRHTVRGHVTVLK